MPKPETTASRIKSLLEDVCLLHEETGNRLRLLQTAIEDPQALALLIKTRENEVESKMLEVLRDLRDLKNAKAAQKIAGAE